MTGKKYERSNQHDDMFAVRFDMGGDFNECMPAQADDKIDIRLWSAGRSNNTGKTADLLHRISKTTIDNAAVYTLDDGAIVYIKRRQDAGDTPFKNTKRN